MTTISDIRAICTAPTGTNLVVVKIETSDAGLYGLGCATYAYRTKAVACVVEDYLRPLLLGREVSRIEEIWHLMHHNAYWRNGPVLNNAAAGVDMALWDILGKQTGQPVYNLLGGKVRDGVAIYRHAEAPTIEALIDRIEALRAEGLRHVRCQINGYGGAKALAYVPEGMRHEMLIDPREYMRSTVSMFEKLRAALGFDVELCHDVHERVAPTDAMALAKRLEPYELFFLEDLLSPEQGDWFRILRQQSTVPIANGELYCNPMEYGHLISERLIDFIRVHTSQIGGLTPARKLAIFAEAFGVRTAWHGPPDVSPVGHAMNVHLDYASHNFGIQEWSPIGEKAQEVFPGSPVQRGGYVYLNEAPGFGVDIDEALAAKYPCSTGITKWTQTRLYDGTPWTP